MQQTFMKTRPVLPLVLSMSLPMVLSMMVASLYNIVDSYYVAKISEDAMTALSLVFPVQNLINAVTIGFSIGANAVISYHLGAQDSRKANAAATQSVFFNALHGVLLTVGCLAIMPFFLRLFTTDEQVIDLGVRYSRIAFAFAVFVAVSMSLEKIFQAVGKMMMTMVCMMSGCIANILLDPVLIFGWGPFPEMGIEGAALATGIGQPLPGDLPAAVCAAHPAGGLCAQPLPGCRGGVARLLDHGIPHGGDRLFSLPQKSIRRVMAARLRAGAQWITMESEIFRSKPPCFPPLCGLCKVPEENHRRR